MTKAVGLCIGHSGTDDAGAHGPLARELRALTTQPLALGDITNAFETAGDKTTARSRSCPQELRTVREHRRPALAHHHPRRAKRVLRSSVRGQAHQAQLGTPLPRAERLS